MILVVGLIIGLVLGLTGAGGSVFAVPLLILLAKLPVNEAIGLALGAVSISALYGSISNWRAHNILWSPALVLGGTGTLFAPLGKLLGNELPAMVLLAGFNFLAIFIALGMWRNSVLRPEYARVVRSGILLEASNSEAICRLSSSGQFEWKFPCVSRLAFFGMVIGLTAGLFGVGGGFMIVPLLIFLTQISMQQAVATSLVIITGTSAAGFFGYISTTTDFHWQSLAMIAAGGLLGMSVGHLISNKVAGPELQRFFAASLLGVVLLTLITQLKSTL